MESTDSSEFLDNTEEKTEQPPLLEVHTEDLLDSEGEGTKNPEADVNAHSPNLVEEKEESPTQKTTGIVGIVMGILAGLAGIGTLIAFLLQHMKIWG
ncbi:EGFR-like transmembrane domain-containing protein [Corynebacterium ulcerans]|nr:transmembrane domain-containing protein [Corynebacterium ulcerans]